MKCCHEVCHNSKNISVKTMSGFTSLRCRFSFRLSVSLIFQTFFISVLLDSRFLSLQESRCGASRSNLPRCRSSRRCSCCRSTDTCRPSAAACPARPKGREEEGGLGGEGEEEFFQGLFQSEESNNTIQGDLDTIKFTSSEMISELLLMIKLD